jgi:ParB family chromosome partitioning protein
MRIDKAKIRYPAKSELQEQNTRPSVFTEKLRGEYYNIDVDKLIPFHKQARKYFDEEALKQLAETIKTHGIRQPLTIISATDDMTGVYEVVSGERRLRAAIIAGLNTVPCIIIDDRKKAEEIAIIENIQRKDLHPIELAQAYSNLLETKICNSTMEIATKVGVHKSAVVETLGLLNLELEVQEKLLNSQVKSRNLLRELCKLNNNEQIIYLGEYLRKEALIKDPENKLNKRKSLKTKSQIFNIVLCGDELFIDKNRIEALRSEQKIQLKALFSSLLY